LPAVFVEAPVLTIAPIVDVAAPELTEVTSQPPVVVAEPVAEVDVVAPVAVDTEKTPEIIVPPVAIPEVVAVDLDKTLAESGLVMVQTTAPAVMAQAEPPPKLGRPRKPKVMQAEGDAPLQMVETQR